jgi:pimeloyl-ACP methyl ester carboxylesterase
MSQLPPYPVIFIPGIQASRLRDDYPVRPETVWALSPRDFLLKDIERIAPHPHTSGPDGSSSFARYYELKGPSRVRSDHLFPTIYEEAIQELRHQLSDKSETEPVPVYPFAYDWRQPLEYIVRDLDDFVREVIERTSLLPHYRGSRSKKFQRNPQVDIVCHSMGGLIAIGLLMDEEARYRDNVRNLVTLGTPFRGSYESVLALTTGRAVLDIGFIKAREATVARLTPALYYMLPSHQPVYYDDTFYDQVEYEFFEPSYWQDNIARGIADSVKAAGFKGLDAEEVFHGFLARARAFREKLEGASLRESRGLCIVGLGEDTRYSLRIDVKNDKLELNLKEFIDGKHYRKNMWDYPDQKNAEDTGDGTVPFRGALSAETLFAREQLVCIDRSDFRYFDEFGDRMLSKAAGLHGALPTMDLVHRLVVRFLLNKEDKYNATWAKPAPHVTKEKWDPPFAGELEDSED